MPFTPEALARLQKTCERAMMTFKEIRMNKDHHFSRNLLYIDRSVPSQLNERIYLSGFDATNHPDNLKSLGITAIVNLTTEANACETDAHFEIYQIPIDDGTALPVYRVHEYIELMEAWEAEGKVVLIHCHAG